MIIFELVGQCLFQNDIFKLQEDFSELGIRVIFENGIRSFQTFLILQIWRKPKVLKDFKNSFENLKQNLKKPRTVWIS
jgi:hypothetical protein